ncbi:hypothetical protein ABE61_12580 [Lysinibacillus sphaericus]|uniref:hypothetical protein n=1 Tax=Lysinibacillus sphaericus TaxID=1421 RepID=UPI0018CC80B4|nr:hypothetical protein [Lysinibacillus sphaericus]MBG9454851.1 hypothetical protein [Lysinibacillus sphaericus]MBG9478279.1 hypothetical protein [Lysinibacillus sphaericus]MBG9590992.1 hypothetical protein [Lysinibacillus sphaericus]
MNNTEWFSIRTLTLPATAVALLVAFFLVWLVIRVQYQKKWAGVYGDAVFTFILVWKFSVIVTDFKVVIAQPFALLYFNGGTIGVFLGVMAVSLQLWWNRKKIHFDETGIAACSWAIILTQTSYQCLVVLLNDNPTNSEVSTLLVLSILTVLILWKITAIDRALFLYTLGLIIVAFFQPLGLWQPAVGVSVILFIVGIGVQRLASVTKSFGGKE